MMISPSQILTLANRHYSEALKELHLIARPSHQPEHNASFVLATDTDTPIFTYIATPAGCLKMSLLLHEIPAIQRTEILSLINKFLPSPFQYSIELRSDGAKIILHYGAVACIVRGPATIISTGRLGYGGDSNTLEHYPRRRRRLTSFLSQSRDVPSINILAQQTSTTITDAFSGNFDPDKEVPL